MRLLILLFSAFVTAFAAGGEAARAADGSHVAAMAAAAEATTVARARPYFLTQARPRPALMPAAPIARTNATFASVPIYAGRLRL